jgi:hypothetical protein
MKFIISILLIALLSLAVCLYLPWWTIAIVAFGVSSFIKQSPAKSFIAGFTALLLLWGSLSWYISSNNNHVLAHKVSMVILKTDNPFLLILATALIGALVAGFASLSGNYLRRS